MFLYIKNDGTIILCLRTCAVLHIIKIKMKTELKFSLRIIYLKFRSCQIELSDSGEWRLHVLFRYPLTLSQSYPREFSVTRETFYISSIQYLATSHIWLLSIYIMTNAVEEFLILLDFI